MRLNAFLFLLLLGVVGLCWAADRDVTRPNYEPLIEGQMSHSPAYSAFAPNPNFPDGLTLRVAPAGTIARGELPLHYKPTPEDAVRAGLELRNPFSAKDEPRLKRGATVFSNYCQVCHGPLGWGDGPIIQGGFPAPPSLIADRALRMPDGQMFHVLTYGQGRMPSVAAQLTRDDRWCAILHVRSMQRFQVPSGGPAAPSLEEIGKLFQQNCIACHGMDGTGNGIRKALPNIPDFTNVAWQVAQTDIALVNQIDYGSLPLMPAFRYKLNREQIQGLALYVRSFAGKATTASLPATTPTTHMTAVDVYQTYCFACHDTTGKGNAFMRKSMPELPDFTSVAWQKSRATKDLSHSILEGKGKFMLSMKDKLGSVNVDEMVKLIRKFEGGKQEIALAAPKLPGPPPPENLTGPIAVPGLPSLPSVTDPGPAPKLVAPSGELAARIRTGSLIFRQYCIICHGPDGTGNIMRASLPPIPNFTKADWQQQASDAQLLFSILNGKGTLMPANNERITRDQARDLVAYVRSFGPALPVRAGPVSQSDFDRAFRQLQRQWDELEKELQNKKK